MTRIDVLGIGFDDKTVEEAVARACKIMRNDEKAYIVTPNPEIVWICRRNKALRDAVNNAGLVLPDGIGIVLGARILGTPLRCGRVPGIDFAAALFDKIAESGGNVFLLGSKPGVAEEAGIKLAEKHPGLAIAGVADGYFTEDGPIIDLINAAAPDLLLVCLGAPKQELWMAENIKRLNSRLCAGLGGSLDVFANRVKRAPILFRKLGLEWFYRLICQPARIKRMIKLPLFIFAVILKRLRGAGTD
jgi:N-acetylglucosaminyldiphosphoundecaprenol N-acetyl-beta-D-mannosaminyltransferase